MLVMLLGQGLLLLIFDGKLGEQANKSHKKQNTRCFPYICPSLVDGVTRYLYWDEVAGTRESGQGEHKLAYTPRVKRKKDTKNKDGDWKMSFKKVIYLPVHWDYFLTMMFCRFLHYLTMLSWDLLVPFRMVVHDIIINLSSNEPSWTIVIGFFVIEPYPK